MSNQNDTYNSTSREGRAGVGLGEPGGRCRLGSLPAVHEAADAALVNAGAGRWITYEIAQATQESFRQEKRGRPGRHPLPQNAQDDLHAHLPRRRGESRLRRRHRRLLPPDQQRPRPHRPRAAHRLPLPAQPRETPPPTQERPRRRPRAAEVPIADRGTGLLSVHRPARPMPHRARATRRHDPRARARTAALPRTKTAPPKHRPPPASSTSSPTPPATTSQPTTASPSRSSSPSSPPRSTRSSTSSASRPPPTTAPPPTPEPPQHAAGNGGRYRLREVRNERGWSVGGAYWIRRACLTRSRRWIR